MRTRVLVSMLVLLAACKGKPKAAPPLDETIATHQNAVQAVLDAASRLGASAMPAVTADAVSTPAPVAVLNADAYHPPGKTLSGNTILAYAAELFDPSTMTVEGYRAPHLDLLNWCAAILRKRAAPASAIRAPGVEATDADGAKYLPLCAQAKFLIAVRVTRGQSASLTGKPALGFPGGAEGFVAGKVDMEALVFELATGRPLGGFRFASTNRDEVRGTPGGTGEGALARDLAQRTWVAIDNAIKANIPGASVPN
jgi:hypothetical protein